MGHVRVVLLVSRTVVTDARRVGDDLLLGDYHRRLLNDHGHRGQGGINGPPENRRPQWGGHPAAAVATVAPVAITTGTMATVTVTTPPALTAMETTADIDALVGIGIRRTPAEWAGLSYTGRHCQRAEKGQRNPFSRNLFHDVDLSGIQVPDVLSVQVPL